MSESVVETDFPILGLLPKKETGILSHLSKHPESDGRGTIIAIFDSGIDPGAPGLQKTSDGKVKVIHRFDCSGCGDVTTSTIVQSIDYFITGLTGRKLKIPSTFKNPTNDYRIGVKHSYELYPESLKERLSTEYKEKKWDQYHRKYLADVNRELVEFESNHTLNNLSDDDKLKKEDIEAKIEVLNLCDKKYSDSGPVYDCVLFHDGDKWMCCVDTSEKGDLENCPLLGEYSVTHDYTKLTEADNLNISFNVHNNGDILELVGLCSSHGTHVASIASGYFPECVELNGAAPGAQIASFTIGDGRLKTMETGTALVRAIIKLIELTSIHKIHVINMSYGEFSHFSDFGRLGELMNDVVNKYGVVWVASAGNRGPALSTVGTPPDISQETIIGVGAYVSPEMMVAAYSMRQKLPGMAFTWSSRGPCIDGAIGISICAPGGAVTSVPTCTLKYSQLMNGTSMASPHVAGCASLLISGLLQKNIKYSPYSIKRSIENTANILKDVEIFAQGNGLLQIDKAFEHLCNYNNEPENNIRFHISCGLSNSKGIYLRSKIIIPTTHTINIKPSFMDSDDITADIKTKFNMRLTLTCSANYVSYPTYLDLSNCSRVFSIKIDPTDLTSGAHITFIEAFDVNCINKGPVFRIPITVIQPEKMNQKYLIMYKNILFQPNSIKRHFYIVPHFATWALVKLISSDNDNIGRFVIHAMHILPRQSCKTAELYKAVIVTSSTETQVGIQVRCDSVLEITIAKYWANVGDINIDYSVNFYGVKPDQQYIAMHASDGVHNIELTTLLGEDVLPTITIKNSVQILKPIEGKVTPMTLRDVIPPNRQIYQLILIYNFSITKPTEVVPNVVLLSDVLYESEFESQFWQLYDLNKQLLGCGDAYPSKYLIKLDKGDFTVRLLIRHEKKEYLEKFIDIPLQIIQKLNTTITLDTYNTYSEAIMGKKKFTTVTGLTSTSIPVYIAPLPSDKFGIKNNNPAQMLVGCITYCKDDLGKKTDLYPFKYFLHDNSIVKKPINNVICDKRKIEEFKEALRDIKIQYFSKLGSVYVETIYDELYNEFSDHIPLHMSFLQSIDPLDVKRAFPPLKLKATFNKEIQMKIINMCHIVANITLKNNTGSNDSIKIKLFTDQIKSTYLECLCRKGIALCRIFIMDGGNVEISNLLTNIWKSIHRFIEANDCKGLPNYMLYFYMWHAAVNKQYGRWLKYALKLQDEKSIKDLEEHIISLFEIMEWKYIALHFKRNFPTKYPTTYRPF